MSILSSLRFCGRPHTLFLCYIITLNKCVITSIISEHNNNIAIMHMLHKYYSPIDMRKVSANTLSNYLLLGLR